MMGFCFPAVKYILVLLVVGQYSHVNCASVVSGRLKRQSDVVYYEIPLDANPRNDGQQFEEEDVPAVGGISADIVEDDAVTDSDSGSGESGETDEAEDSGSGEEEETANEENNEDTADENSADKRDDSTANVIQYLDGLAKGTVTTVKFGNCPVTKIQTSQKCASGYQPTETCSISNVMYALFKDLPREKMQNILGAGISRNIIQAEKYIFTPQTQIILDTCKQDKKLVLKDFVSAEPIQPVPWLTLRNVAITEAYLYYQEIVEQTNSEWIRVGVKGTASVDLAGEDVQVKIDKPSYDSQIGSSNKKIGDPDAVLSLQVPSKSVELSKFMQLVQMDTTSLYPEKYPHFPLQLDDLAVKMDGSKSSMIDVILSNDKMWNAYLVGKAIGSTVFKTASKFYVYCKNGEIDEPRKVVCAIMSKFKKGTFKWTDLTSGFDLNDASYANTIPIVKTFQDSEEMYFQTSRDGFMSPDSETVAKEFAPYSSADDNGIQISEKFVTPEVCVRYRIADFSRNFPALQSKKTLNTIIVHACPSAESFVTIRFPEIFPDAVFKYGGLPSIVQSSSVRGPQFGIDPLHYMKLTEIEISMRMGGGHFFCESFIPAEKYQMLPEKPGAVELGNTSLKQCSSDGSWVLSGSGKEVILKSLSDVKIVSKNKKRHGITGKANIFDIEDLLQITGSSFLNEEYQTALPNLMEFPLKNLVYEAFFQRKKQFYLKGKAKMNDVGGINAEILYYYKQSTGDFDLALCLTKTDFNVDEMLHYFMDNKLEKNLWKTYTDFGLIARKDRDNTRFDRALCKGMENAYDSIFPRRSKLGFNGGVMFYAHSIYINKCEVKGTEDKICKFFDRVFVGNNLLMMYFGQLYPNGFYMEGHLQGHVMSLGPGIRLRGSREKSKFKSRRGKLIHVIETKRVPKEDGDEDEMIERDFMQGDLWLQTVSTKIPTILRFAGETVLFEIPLLKDDQLNENVLGIENVRSIGIKAESHPIPLEEPIEFIELHSKLKIGSNRNRLIRMKGGIGTTAQHIYGQDATRNKFFACRNPKEILKLRKVFEAFGAPFYQAILNNANVHKACFTYHQGTEGDTWEITTQGILAEKGLRLHGELKADFGENLPITMLFENNGIKMALLLPVLEWGVTESEKERIFPGGEKRKVKRRQARFEATTSEDVDTMGPKYHLEYQNGIFKEGYIEGYLRTMGYAGPGKIYVRPNSDGHLNTYEFEYEGALFGNFPGGLSLSATFAGADIKDIDFDLTIDVYDEVSSKIGDVTSDVVSSISSSYDRITAEFDKSVTKYSDLIQKHTTIYNKILQDIAKTRNIVSRSKIERARSVQAASKRCARECQAVEMPGLKWFDNCMRTRDGHQFGCMKFVNNKHVVSDVGCVSKCESERVRSHVDAVNKDTIARNNIDNLSHSSECKVISEGLLAVLNEQKRSLDEVKQELAEKGEVMKQLKKASESGSLISVQSITSNSKLSAASEASCLPFNLDYQITTAEDRFSKGQQLEETFCFDGTFIKSIAERALTQSYKNDLDILDSALEKADVMQVNMKEEFGEKIGKVEHELESCIKNQKRMSNSNKKAYIPHTDLSPLRSSLFHVFSDETILMFNKYSPWAMLKKNNAFKDLTNRKPVTKSTVEDENKYDHCASARNTLQDYQDIIAYMKTWATTHNHGSDVLEEVRGPIEKRVHVAKDEINQMASDEHLRPTDVVNMKHWMNVTEQGMKKWVVDSTKQLHRLNKEGLQLMRNELFFMYTNKKYKSFEQYLKHTAKNANDAFKKANIATKHDEFFSYLSKDILNLLQESASLKTMLPVIEKMEGKIQNADKRSISCVSNA